MQKAQLSVEMLTCSCQLYKDKQHLQRELDSGASTCRPFERTLNRKDGRQMVSEKIFKILDYNKLQCGSQRNLFSVNSSMCLQRKQVSECSVAEIAFVSFHKALLMTALDMSVEAVFVLESFTASLTQKWTFF